MPPLHIPWVKCARALCLVAVLLVAACAPAQPKVAPVTIRFAHLDTDKAYYQRLAKEFAKSHPGVTVQLIDTTWTGLANLGPKDADVAYSSDALQRRERGDIIDLDAFLAGDETFDKADYYPGLLDLFAYQGRTAAVPVDTNPIVMYYNKSLFDKRGVAYPKPGWTWDDFLNAARALTDRDKGIYGYACDPDASDYEFWVLTHGASLFDNWQNPTRATFTDPRTVEAVEWYAALIHQYHVAPTPDEAEDAFRSYTYAQYFGIQDSLIGMWLMSYSSQGGRGWRSPWRFKWGMTTMPREKLTGTWVGVDALVISSAAQHPEVCWQWISFLSHQMPNAFAPARRSLAESTAFEKKVGTETAAVVRASLEQSLYYSSAATSDWQKRAYEALATAKAAFLSGEKTPAQALAEAQAEADK